MNLNPPARRVAKVEEVEGLLAEGWVFVGTPPTAKMCWKGIRALEKADPVGCD